MQNRGDIGKTVSFYSVRGYLKEFELVLRYVDSFTGAKPELFGGDVVRDALQTLKRIKHCEVNQTFEH